eukprot:COSAG01_NODE_8918_length_2614_cov_1.600398_2_plen_182_part_00
MTKLLFAGPFISSVHPHSLRECAPSLPRTPRVARCSSEMETGCGRLEATPPARHDNAGRKTHSILHPAETAVASGRAVGGRWAVRGRLPRRGPECHQSHILIDRAACWGHPSTQSCASSAGTPPRAPELLAPHRHTRCARAHHLHTRLRFPLRFRPCIIMIRTEDSINRNVGGSQSLIRFL